MVAKSFSFCIAHMTVNNANARLVKPSNGLRKNTQVVNIANATFRSPGPSSGNIQTQISVESVYCLKKVLVTETLHWLCSPLECFFEDRWMVLPASR